MQNYPFNFETLFSFSNSNPYVVFDEKKQRLFEQLNILKEKYHFPAITNDVGSLISFLVGLTRPQNIFEMGSGYGHSCFWYFIKENNFIQNIYLTEKRDDLIQEFNSLPWSEDQRQKISYFQGDAFEKLAKVESLDFVLIDGVKADYLNFLDACFEKLNSNAIVLIDNSFWRGSFLDENMLQKKSALHIKQLHDYLKQNTQFTSVFLPYRDGVSLLRKSAL